MRKLLLLISFIIALPLFAQKETMTISSPQLGEDREITISLPLSYTKDSKKKFPLVFLLDGDYLMDPFLGALNYGAFFEDFPEVIVVGLTQNYNHERETDCVIEEATGLPIGKGNIFFDFIGMEVIPMITKKYRVAPFKIIAGHDITAAFANFFLYKDQPLFNAYISISPELPTMMEEQVPERLQLVNQPLFYYQSTCDGDVKKMQDKIIMLDALAKEINRPNINYKFDYFKNASHYSMVLQSIPNALYHVFASYRPISTDEFTQKIVPMTTGQTEYLKNKYEMLESLFSIKKPVRYLDFKAIASGILNTGNFEELEKLSEYAKKIYPKSLLSDYYLAVMNEKTGLLDKAKKNFKDAYQKEAIGELTKDMMLSKIYEYKEQ
jgi:uncharacterized protein